MGSARAPTHSEASEHLTKVQGDLTHCFGAQIPLPRATSLLRRHFALSDSEKFTEVWLMNEEEAKGLMRKALDADFVIHTQQLGLHWEEPHYWFLNNVGPLGCYKAKRRATELAAQILTGGTHSALVTLLSPGHPHLPL